MEINEYRPRHIELNRTSSEYDASRIKSQHIKPSGQEEGLKQPVNNESSIDKGEIIGASPMDDLIHKALNASGLSASDRNVAILQELINYQMPVDKNTILQFIKLAAAYPDVDPATLVLMYKNKLPINVNSIAQFEAYQRGMHQILTQLKSLIDHIYNDLDAFSSDTDESKPGTSLSGDYNGSVTSGNDSLNNTKTANDAFNNTGQSINSFVEAGSYNDNLNDIGLSKGNPNDTGLSNNSLNDVGLSNDKTYDVGLSNDNLYENGLSYDNLSSKSLENGDINKDKAISLYHDLLALISDKEGGPKGLSPDTALEYIFSNEELTKLGDILLPDIREGSLYNKEEIINISKQLSDGSMTLESLFRLVNDLFSKDSLPSFSENPLLPLHMLEAFLSMSSQQSSDDNKKLIRLLKSDVLRETISKVFHQRWTLSPEELPQENKVRDFYKRLDKDMEYLNKLSDNFKMTRDVSLSINKLQDNLQFMKDLNELFIYLQLPIRLPEQDTHGDLYVFTRKKHRHHDNENLNVLLHLDMTHLGPVDIHLSMMNRQVNAVFYLNETSEKVIARHLHELTDMLNDKGFQLQVRTQVSESKPDFINDILQHDAPSSNTHRYSFDIKA